MIAQLKESNEKVFEEVYGLLHRKVFRFFLRKTHTNDTATELTQQVFIKLWQYRHTLKEEYTIDIQLLTVANSVLVDHIRRTAHRQQVQSSLEVQEPVSSQGMLAFERQDYLEAVMAQLPPVRKKVVELRVMHGLTNKEIAGQLSIQIKTVEDHITKAIRHMKVYTDTNYSKSYTIL